MSEEWRPVPIPEVQKCYSVSDLGRVRSESRMVCCSKNGAGRRLVPQIILRPGLASNGYLSVLLMNAEACFKRTFMVHDLVLRAFVGPPEGRVARHGAEGRLVNKLTNLCYGSYQDNYADSAAVHERSRRSLRKFTHAELIEIRKKIASGRSYNSIGDDYGVDHGAIRAIAVGRTYKYTGDET